MKKILIFALCAVSQCFASVALVQSNVGGSASGTVAADGDLTSTTGSFSVATTTGHLLVLVSYSTAAATAIIFNSGPAVSGGYTGTFILTDNCGVYIRVPSGDEGAACIWYIANAPSMSPSQIISMTQHNGDHGSSHNLANEFDLYEFSGVANPLVCEIDDSPPDCAGSSASGIGGTPSFGVTATLNTNLILVAMSAVPGGNLTAGSGYTLGINSSVATIGQFQYKLNAAPGESSVTFTGTEPFDWGIMATAFEVAPSPPVTSVSRHEGSVF